MQRGDGGAISFQLDLAVQTGDPKRQTPIGQAQVVDIHRAVEAGLGESTSPAQVHVEATRRLDTRVENTEHRRIAVPLSLEAESGGRANIDRGLHLAISR